MDCRAGHVNPSSEGCSWSQAGGSMLRGSAESWLELNFTRAAGHPRQIGIGRGRFRFRWIWKSRKFRLRRLGYRRLRLRRIGRLQRIIWSWHGVLGVSPRLNQIAAMLSSTYQLRPAMSASRFASRGSARFRFDQSGLWFRMLVACPCVGDSGHCLPTRPPATPGFLSRLGRKQ
jgi:hypothetical protein